MVRIVVIESNFSTRVFIVLFVECVFCSKFVVKCGCLIFNVWLQLLIEFICLLHISLLVKKQFVGEDYFALFLNSFSLNYPLNCRYLQYSFRGGVKWDVVNFA